VSVDATVELWERLARPFEASAAIEAVVGLHPTAARQLVGVELATSLQADELLDRMHEIVRSLAVATTSSPTRTEGEVRGPILWAETIAARSASPGAGNALICASPVKAYDTDENHVLVHALRMIRDAARSAAPAGRGYADDEAVRRARFNGGRAIRALEHRTLASVHLERPTARAVQKARSGLRARNYRAAVAVLERAREPLEAEVVALRCDEHHQRQHGLLLALADRVGERRFRVDAATLRAGKVRFVPEHRAEAGEPYGVRFGRLLLDVPDPELGNDPGRSELRLVERSLGHPVLVVTGPRDIERALRLAEDA
jgi:hypothetical protein